MADRFTLDNHPMTGGDIDTPVERTTDWTITDNDPQTQEEKLNPYAHFGGGEFGYTQRCLDELNRDHATRGKWFWRREHTRRIDT